VCQTPHPRLALFGSATREHFDPVTSDVDGLVEFHSMPPAPHADRYFGLMEDLHRRFGIPIDLVEAGSIRNRSFRQAIAATQVSLYDAA
jgi:uncharacterized protein